MQKYKRFNKSSSFLIGLSACVFASISQAASIFPLIPYNPYAPLPFQFRAGLDFNDSGHGAPGLVTQPGFLSVPESNLKTYSLSHNGISIDIQVRNANLDNQNRWRGAGSFPTAGALMNDFEQWYGNNGNPVEATFSLSGLEPSTPYFLDFYHFNVGSGQTTLTFYNGTSTAVAALIGTNTTSGGNSNYATWEPGTIIKMSSDINGELDITAQSTYTTEGRITLAGFAISVPEPSHSTLLGLGATGIILRRRR